MNFWTIFLIIIGLAMFFTASALADLLIQTWHIGPEDDLTPDPKYAEYEWVKRVINSCETMEQTMTAENLLELWAEKHSDPKLYERLLDLLNRKERWILR